MNSMSSAKDIYISPIGKDLKGKKVIMTAVKNYETKDFEVKVKK